MIRRAKKILLATHEGPDGDALGAMLAMKAGLEKLGKEVVAFCRPSVPSEFRFLPGAGETKKKPDLDKVDLVIGLDYGSFNRLGLDEKILDQVPLLTIDHHQIDGQKGFLIMDSECSSTCEIIYDFFNYLGVKLDSAMATCFLTGIYDDTGGFRHPNTSARTLKIVADLLSRGALLQKIVTFTSKTDFKNRMSSLNKALSRLSVDDEAGIVYSLVNFDEVSAIEKEFDTAGIANILNSIPDVNLAVLLIESEPGIIDVRLRTRHGRGVDVAKIAREFGGGGHKLAAGFQAGSSPEEILLKLKEFISRDLTGC